MDQHREESPSISLHLSCEGEGSVRVLVAQEGGMEDRGEQMLQKAFPRPRHSPLWPHHYLHRHPGGKIHPKHALYYPCPNVPSAVMEADG